MFNVHVYANTCLFKIRDVCFHGFVLTCRLNILRSIKDKRNVKRLKVTKKSHLFVLKILVFFDVCCIRIELKFGYVCTRVCTHVRVGLEEK